MANTGLYASTSVVVGLLASCHPSGLFPSFPLARVKSCDAGEYDLSSCSCPGYFDPVCSGTTIEHSR